jgi:hypothetical protein
MIKIGFVVEGICEALLVDSANFRAWASQHALEIDRAIWFLNRTRC